METTLASRHSHNHQIRCLVPHLPCKNPFPSLFFPTQSRRDGLLGSHIRTKRKILGSKVLATRAGSSPYTKGPSRGASSGVRWSFAPGTNLPYAVSAKIERQSMEKLNEFAKELRTFESNDLSGRNFGDEGLYFLAESLGFNQTAEEVDFSANGITADGLKALVFFNQIMY